MKLYSLLDIISILNDKTQLAPYLIKKKKRREVFLFVVESIAMS